MFICIDMYMYMYIYIRIHKYLSIYIHIFVCIYMYEYVYTTNRTCSLSSQPISLWSHKNAIQSDIHTYTHCHIYICEYR